MFTKQDKLCVCVWTPAMFPPVCQLLSPEIEVVPRKHKRNTPQLAALHSNRGLKVLLFSISPLLAPAG